jgi:FAD/FMN-containing dehydrogenase
MTMPRTLQEILEHADELERRFADHDPANVRDAEPLRALRDAVTERAATERRIAEAVTAAREAGVSWSAIGGMLGTSGEAARKRYSVSTKTA